MDLVEFAIKSQTCLSVNPRGTDKEYYHLYLSRVYDPLFGQLKPIRSLLEIGIGGGGSIELWLKYLSPELIIAIDTDKNFYESLEKRKLPKVKPIFGDAYSRNVYKKLPNDLDVIIDDGPHAYWSLKAVIRVFMTRLRPGGTLVVEDIPNIEVVLSRLLLSADKNLVCCFWIFDSRQEARLAEDSVALLIHRKGNECKMHFKHGQRVFIPTFCKSNVIRLMLYFERCYEFLNRKIYHGTKFRIKATTSFL